MARPDKKLSVTPETRKKWLRRHEEYGESPPQIAAKEGYDIRTVRKQLDMARQEQETRESRLMVLREAAQAHYADLCQRASQMESDLPGGSRMIDLQDRMCLALRQHLPRAPLWKFIEQWNDIQKELRQIRIDLKTRYENELSQYHQLSGITVNGTGGVPMMAEFFARQSEIWVQGGSGVDVAEAFRTDRAGEGSVDLRLGAYYLGTVAEAQAGGVKKALLDFRANLTQFDEYDKLGKLLKKLDELAPEIRDELAIITLRRVLPGRCKYCPI